jgi:hypothetical protein
VRPDEPGDDQVVIVNHEQADREKPLDRLPDQIDAQTWLGLP